MNSSNTTPPLDTDQLARRLAALVHKERTLLVEFLQHLARFDAAKLYAGFGYPSMFAYCTERLRLSEASSWRRIATARLMQRFPVIGDFLADGRLSLKRVCLLRDVLTPENHADLLHRASLGTEDEVAILVASLRPRPDVPDSIRKLPAVSSPAPTASAAVVKTQAPELHLVAPVLAETPAATSFGQTPAPALEPTPHLASLALAPAPTPSHREPHMDLEPLSATTHLMRLTVSAEFVAEFEQVKAALSHKIPSGDFEQVFRECFRVTLEACERRRLGSDRRAESKQTQSEEKAPSSVATKTAPSPRAADQAATTPSKKNSRYIPIAVRRKVWKRDGGLCAFISADGKRCGSNHQVDFHHEDPFARGGPPTVENLSLRCRLHNHYEAILDFGAEFMESRIARALSPNEKSLSRRKCGAVASPAPEPDASH